MEFPKNVEELREKLSEPILQCGTDCHLYCKVEYQNCLECEVSKKHFDKIFTLLSPIIEILDRTREKCSMCKGTGKRHWYDASDSGNYVSDNPCPFCRGTGLTGWKPEKLVVLDEVQRYIDENNIYRVEFGHYEPPLYVEWIPLKTRRINIMEALDVK